MQNVIHNTMRDALISRITELMRTRADIFFLSADFGAPALDALRTRFPRRFFNVGIAEQNLVNVAAGLALEGNTVYAYAIAPFITMRCFEQIRVNLSILSQYRPMNVNLIGVGAGASYEMSGPTHHCFEDLSVMRTLPNIDIFSPCDTVITQKFVDYTAQHHRPKYMRLDSKSQEIIYKEKDTVDFTQGFSKIRKGSDVVIVATGSMTHKAVRISERLSKLGCSAGVIDFFLLRPFNETALARCLKKAGLILTIEEAFVNKGGLDALVSSVAARNGVRAPFHAFGYGDAYITKSLNREELACCNGMGDEEIVGFIMSSMSGKRSRR